MCDGKGRVWPGHEWAPYGTVPGDGGGEVVAFPDEPWRRRPDGGWEPGFQGDLCMCGEVAELVRVADGRAWYVCSCGVRFTGPERGIPEGKQITVKEDDMDNIDVKAEPFWCPRCGAHHNRGYFPPGAVGTFRCMGCGYQGPSGKRPVGKLLPRYHVEGVSVEESGEGWVVGFGEGSMALCYYEGDEGSERELCVAGWPRGVELVDGQGRWARKAVRAYLSGEALVQQVFAGESREWTVLFPMGLRVRVSEPEGEGTKLYASQDDIESWLAGLDDEQVAKWRDKATAAVSAWRVKHDGVKLGVDGEFGEFERTDPRTAADNLGSLVRKARDEDLEGWKSFGLPPQYNHAISKGVTVSTEAGVELDAGDYRVKRYESLGWKLYLSPEFCANHGGCKVVVARNGARLADYSIPEVEGARPQVRAVHQGVGGWAGEGPYQGRPYHDWHVRFHDGVLVWVREWLDEGDLHCPTKGRPATGGEPDNSGVKVLSKYGPVAERVVNAEIEQIDDNVVLTQRGLGFAVEIGFSDAGRIYEWAWTTPHIPPHEGDEEGWHCLTEYDPHDKSGWRERSLELLLRGLRQQYRCQDADCEFEGAPGHDVICWTDKGPVRCSVHPEKEPDGTAYILVDVPGGRPVDVMTRIEKAVKAHWHKPSEKQVDIERKLAEMVDVTEECLERGRQIEAAADGRGFYPVTRAADRPDDDPERVTRYNVATEEGVVFVRASWAKMGDEQRVVAYDVEDTTITKFLRQRVVEAVQAHIKNEHLAALGFPKTMPHDSGVLSECKCQRDHEADEQRCPHDGGACHHDCKPGKCYRESAGMALTSPHDGYPLVPEGWVCFDLLGANVGVPDDHNVYLDAFRLTPGRKMDYVFHKVAQNDWRLAVDPSVVASHLDRGQGEALLRICHMDSSREIPSKDVHEQSAADIMHPPRQREVEVWRYKWQFSGTEAEDTVRHTDHCYKRMIHGDGECECGGRVGVQPAEPVKYIEIPQESIPATMCTTHVFSTEPEKTKPTLEGLETRIHNMEMVISEIEDGALMARVRKLENAIAQLDSKAFGRMESVAQMDGRVQQALKGVAAHEEWLQGLERRFAEAAVSGGDKASRALLKTVLDQARELDSRTAAQKDLGSALSKKVGELGHLVDETRNANLRIERLVCDLGQPVAKLIEIVAGCRGMLSDLAEDEGNLNLLAQFKALQEEVESWRDDEDTDEGHCEEDDPCASCEHEECDHCEGCGCVYCECECDEDEALAAKAQEVLDDEDDEAVPFDQAAEQIREQSFPVGTHVGFCGNSTMKGIVKGVRKGPTGPERMVSWKDEKETTGGGWYGVDSLYELEEEEYEPLGVRPGKIARNGPRALGATPLVIPTTGLYMSSAHRQPVKLQKGTYSLIAGVGEPEAMMHWSSDGEAIHALVPTGVGVLVIKDSLRGGQWVLMGKRKGAHGEGQWSFPGGRVEPGERPVDCAVRELEEETGIVMHPSRLQVWQFCPFNNTITGGQPWVTLFYWVQVSDEEGKHELREPHKCSEWDYFLTKNMPEPLFEAAAECARQSGWTIRSEVDHCSDD
ncbi:MAG: NUDIX domain-containing protein [Thermoplasmata archaeon]|nr:NUDIX domain-containing protein [Thermoplasmata archaeon]NIY05898.1 NUDIX domain-containing protein [Thermoplasmata archaeon]